MELMRRKVSHDETQQLWREEIHGMFGRVARCRALHDLVRMYRASLKFGHEFRFFSRGPARTPKGLLKAFMDPYIVLANLAWVPQPRGPPCPVTFKFDESG